MSGLTAARPVVTTCARSASPTAVFGSGVPNGTLELITCVPALSASTTASHPRCAAVERAGHRARHIEQPEWLGEDELQMMPRRLIGIDLLAPARHDPDRQVRPPTLERGGDLPAGHARHREIGDHEIEDIAGT